jgi:hypothetical protein
MINTCQRCCGRRFFDDDGVEEVEAQLAVLIEQQQIQQQEGEQIQILGLAVARQRWWQSIFKPSRVARDSG